MVVGARGPPVKSEPQVRCKIALSQSSFRSEPGRAFPCPVQRIEWSGVVLSDLQARLEKFERKAAQYGKSAQDATCAADRAFYHGLACYCDDLAAQFRQVIAKRSDTSQAAE